MYSVNKEHLPLTIGFVQYVFIFKYCFLQLAFVLPLIEKLKLQNQSFKRGRAPMVGIKV